MMLTTLLTSLLLAGCSSPVSVIPAAFVAPQPQSTLEEELEAFSDLLKGKEHEAEAIARIDAFLKHHQTNAERLARIAEDLELGIGDARELKREQKDLLQIQDTLAKAVYSSFSYRKRVTEPHMRLWNASVYALGQMGAEGGKYLWVVFKDKRFSKDVEFTALVVRQVGETRDWTQAEDLVKLFKSHHQEVVVAAAAEAMGMLQSAPGKVRQDMVGEMVKVLESAHNRALNYEDTDAGRIYRTISRPIRTALTNLTGEGSISDPLEWTKWWNKNKNNREVWKDAE